MADDTTLYEDAILDYNGLKTYDSWIKKYITDYAYSKSAVASTLTNYYKKNETYSQTEINDKLSTKPPSEHASAYTGYGAGTTNYYGHVKLINGDVSSKKLTDGEAAAAAHNHDGHHSKTDHTHTLGGNKITGVLPLSKGGTGISASSKQGLLTSLGIQQEYVTGWRLQAGRDAYYNTQLQVSSLSEAQAISATYVGYYGANQLNLSPITVDVDEQGANIVLYARNSGSQDIVVSCYVLLWHK